MQKPLLIRGFNILIFKYKQMYKKRQVVMLPTDKEARNVILSKHIAGVKHDFLEMGQKDYLYTRQYLKSIGLKANHLYIISDEEIKEGDWTYHPITGIGIIKEYLGEMCYYSKHESGGSITTPWKRNLGDKLKKIIASTDKSLNLPQPSEAFIKKYVEEYNKGNVIEEVMVEYNSFMYCFKCDAIKTKNECDFCDSKGVPYIKEELKINGNTITIKKIKDSWNRWEVEQLCKDAYHSGAIREYGFEEQHWNDWKQQYL